MPCDLSNVQVGDRLLSPDPYRRAHLAPKDPDVLVVAKVGRDLVHTVTALTWDRSGPDGGPGGWQRRDLTPFRKDTGVERADRGEVRRAYTPQGWEDRKRLQAAQEALRDARVEFRGALANHATPDALQAELLEDVLALVETYRQKAAQ